jgi:hypothetical protein
MNFERPGVTYKCWRRVEMMPIIDVIWVLSQKFPSSVACNSIMYQYLKMQVKIVNYWFPEPSFM